MSNTQSTKICTKCQGIFPATSEFFYYDAAQSSGLRPECKVCKKRAKKQYRDNNQGKHRIKSQIWKRANKERIAQQERLRYFAHKEKINKRSQEYYRKNKERIRTQRKTRYERNREEVLIQSRQWYQNNREDRLAKNREWRESNKERAKETARQWKIANPDKVKERARRWRARHPEKVRESGKQWRINNADHFKDMHRAHHAIEKAIRHGKMTPSPICEKCTIKIKTQAHHYKGYAKEYHLTVQWLCQSCHMRAHYYTTTPL